MVDLPGLFLAGNKDQSEQDAALVEALVLSYMKNPRTIILAVVSAKSDFALQQGMSKPISSFPFPAVSGATMLPTLRRCSRLPPDTP
jgi:hypothetical protein